MRCGPGVRHERQHAADGLLVRGTCRGPCPRHRTDGAVRPGDVPHHLADARAPVAPRRSATHRRPSRPGPAALTVGTAVQGSTDRPRPGRPHRTSQVVCGQRGPARRTRAHQRRGTASGRRSGRGLPVHAVGVARTDCHAGRAPPASGRITGATGRPLTRWGRSPSSTAGTYTGGKAGPTARKAPGRAGTSPHTSAPTPRRWESEGVPAP